MLLHNLISAHGAVASTFFIEVSWILDLVPPEHSTGKF